MLRQKYTVSVHSSYNMETVEKVYTPTVIPDTPFPQQAASDLTVSQQTGGAIYSPQEIQEQDFPVKKMAQELLSTALNTRSKKIIQEFQFTPSGAIQVGEYQQGVAGDVRISPNGITARNITGDTTFALDGDTGDAVFAGTMRSGSVIAGSVITGQVDVGNGLNNSYVRLDGANNRIIIHDGVNPRIVIGNI